MNEPVVLKGFPNGMDNRSPETGLSPGYARLIENLDVQRNGTLVLRPGYRLVSAGAAHSIYCPEGTSFALCVKGSNLVKITIDNINVITETPLVSVTQSAMMSYAVHNGDVFWSNGIELGSLSSTAAIIPWGIPRPSTIVAFSIGTGGLYAGSYQIAYAAINSSGLESATSDAVSVTVAEGGGISVVLPIFDSGVTGYRIFLTSVNGSDFFKILETSSSGTTVSVGVGDRGKPPEAMLHVAPMPGQIVRSFKSHLLIAVGDILRFTPPFNPHVIQPFRNNYKLPSMISMMQPVEDGVFVATTESTWFYAGTNLMDSTRQIVNYRGAVPGTGLELPPTVFQQPGAGQGRTAGWWDTEGVFCVGRPGGTVQRITEQFIGMDTPAIGSTVCIKKDGTERVISFLRGISKQTNRVAQDMPVSITHTNGITDYA